MDQKSHLPIYNVAFALLKDLHKFLGYMIKSTYTLVRRKVIKRFKTKFFKVLDQNGLVSIGDIPMIQSYKGHFDHAYSSGLCKKFRLID